MKFLFSIIFSVFLVSSNAQIKLLVNDSSKVKCGLDKAWPEIDSVVIYFIDNANKLTYCDSYRVYYDKDFQKLAYESGSIGDTCKTINYWPNGKLKKKTLYYKNKNGDPIWWYDEVYCKNGNLIFKGPSPNQPGKNLFTYYYCNGNKKLEYYFQTMGPVGKVNSWYENGKLTYELLYDDNNKPTGDWKYWTVEGKLEKVESYENGELNKTSNY